jgi:hypothetical protein
MSIQIKKEFKEEIEKIMSGESHLSYSALKAFLTSPYHFYRYKTEKETTKAMIEGVQFHMAVLEPGKFKEKYFVLDDSSIVLEIGGGRPRNTSKYKDWKNEQLELNSGKEEIAMDLYNSFLLMGEYLTINKATKSLMSGLTHREKDFEFEHDGFKIKGKIDGEGSDYTLDLKKAAFTNFNKIKFEIIDKYYDMQGAIYGAAVNKSKHYIPFISADLSLRCIQLSPDSLDLGWQKFEYALSEFTRCAEEESWLSSYEFFTNNKPIII